MNKKKNIFILGQDQFTLNQLKAMPQANQYNFYSLCSYAEIKGEERYSLDEIVNRARAILRSFHNSIDGIVGWWDCPVSTVLPILRREFALPTPTLESLLQCEHKYWSRLEQQRSIPDHIPEFYVFNPFDDDPLRKIPLKFPFWIKPIKAAASYLGFKVQNRQEFNYGVAMIRKNIHHMAEPFNYILNYADLPTEIKRITGEFCIAEEMISLGRQCTLEGYVYEGDVQVYGTVDSIRDRTHRSCFARYQYPSSFPAEVRQRMAAIARQFLTHIQYDNSPFNAEFFWERRHNHLWLLEVNTRISKSHCPLFKLVDGVSNQKVMLDLATGQAPDFPHRQGQFPVAAKFMVRHFQDAIVLHTPSKDEIQAIQQRFPGTEIELHVRPGRHLSELANQDSYSYEVAVIFMGAKNQRELLANYRACLEQLGLQFADKIPGGTAL
jgi:hypothetical protein